MQEQEVVQQIRDTVERWTEGKVDAKTFDAFLSESNKKLDAIKAQKERSAEFWQKYEATCFY